MEEQKQQQQDEQHQQQQQEVTNYYCSNCQLYLQSNAEYKIHYKSEFHRYNIKRKLVELPPVTSEQYQSLMLEQKNQQAQGQKSSSDLYCQLCHKSFSTSSTFKQHQSSNKHKQLEKEQQNALKKYENQQQQQQQQQENNNNENKNNDENKNNMNEIEAAKNQKHQEHIKTTIDDINICLFCNQPSKDIQENMLHMRQTHSFFISEPNFIKNLEGLIRYLAEKINIGLLCIYCENKKTKDFKSPQAVRKHMFDKGHCFMNTENFDEYEDFYDFSSQLHEFEIIDAKKKKQLQQENKKEEEGYIEIVSDKEGDDEKESDDQNDDDDDEYEEVSDDEWNEEDGEGAEKNVKDKEKDESNNNNQEQKNTDLETAKQLGKEQFRNKKKKIKKKKQFIRVKKVKLLDTGELYIPESKKIVGHRDYRIYYKQYFRNMNSSNKYVQQMIGHNVYEDRLQKFDNTQRQLMLIEKLNEVRDKKLKKRYEEDFKSRQQYELKFH